MKRCPASGVPCHCSYNSLCERIAAARRRHDHGIIAIWLAWATVFVTFCTVMGA